MRFEVGLWVFFFFVDGESFFFFAKRVVSPAAELAGLQVQLDLERSRSKVSEVVAIETNRRADQGPAFTEFFSTGFCFSLVDGGVVETEPPTCPRHHGRRRLAD